MTVIHGDCIEVMAGMEPESVLRRLVSADLTNVPGLWPGNDRLQAALRAFLDADPADASFGAVEKELVDAVNEGLEGLTR